MSEVTHQQLPELVLHDGELKQDETYRHASLDWVIGKKLEAVGSSSWDGPHGPEPMTVLFFEGGLFHGFVHAAEND